MNEDKNVKKIRKASLSLAAINYTGGGSSMVDRAENPSKMGQQNPLDPSESAKGIINSLKEVGGQLEDQVFSAMDSIIGE